MNRYSNFQTEVCLGIIKLGIAGIGLIFSLAINIIFALLKGIITIGHRVL